MHDLEARALRKDSHRPTLGEASSTEVNRSGTLIHGTLRIFEKSDDIFLPCEVDKITDTNSLVPAGFWRSSGLALIHLRVHIRRGLRP